MFECRPPSEAFFSASLSALPICCPDSWQRAVNLSAPALLRRDAVPVLGIQASDFRLHRSLLSLVVISLELSQIAFADTTRRLILFLPLLPHITSFLY